MSTLNNIKNISTPFHWTKLLNWKIIQNKCHLYTKMYLPVNFTPDIYTKFPHQRAIRSTRGVDKQPGVRTHSGEWVNIGIIAGTCKECYDWWRANSRAWRGLFHSLDGTSRGLWRAQVACGVLLSLRLREYGKLSCWVTYKKMRMSSE